MNKNIVLKITIIIMILSTLFVGCNHKKDEQNEEQKTIKIGVMPSLDYLPIAVADKMGIFEKNGLNVEIQKFFSANDRDAALQSKNIDGTIIDYTGAAIQQAGGIEIFLTSKCDGQFGLVGKSDDLNHKKVAISRNTVIDYCTDKAIEHFKLKYENVERVEINKIPLRLEMLSNDKIDFTFLPEPFVTIAKMKGAKSIISMKDLNLNVTGIVFNKETIENKKEELQLFYASYNQAVEHLNNNIVDSLKKILVEEIKFPPKVVDNVQLPKYTKAELPNDNDLKSVSEWLKNRELISNEYNIETLVNSEFISKN